MLPTLKPRADGKPRLSANQTNPVVEIVLIQFLSFRDTLGIHVAGGDTIGPGSGYPPALMVGDPGVGGSSDFARRRTPARSPIRPGRHDAGRLCLKVHEGRRRASPVV
jgi:hypothetical protein